MRYEPFSIESKIAILEKNAPIAREFLSDCTVCPRECHVDRTAGELGECGISAELKVSSANLHHGEEPPISGTAGPERYFYPAVISTANIARTTLSANTEMVRFIRSKKSPQ